MAKDPVLEFLGIPDNFDKMQAIYELGLQDAASAEQASTAVGIPTPTTTAKATPKEEEEKSLISRVLDPALYALDTGNRLVTRPVVGAIAKAVSDNPEIDNAESNTAAFEKAFEGHRWLRFAVEAGLDPLNLVGVGLVGKIAKLGKLAKAIDEGTALGRAVDTAQAADEIAGRLQALPINLLLGTGKKTAGVLGNALGKSNRGQANEQVGAFVSALENARRARSPLVTKEAATTADTVTPPTKPSPVTPETLEAARDLVDELDELVGRRAAVTDIIDTTRQAPIDVLQEAKKIMSIRVNKDNFLAKDIVKVMEMAIGEKEQLGLIEKARDLPDAAKLAEQTGAKFSRAQRAVEAIRPELTPEAKTFVDVLKKKGPITGITQAIEQAPDEVLKSALPELDADLSSLVQREINRRSSSLIPSPSEAAPQTDLAADATVRETVARIADEHGATGEQAARISDMLEKAVGTNPVQFQARQLWETPEAKKHLEAAFFAPDEKTARNEMAAALRQVNDTWSSFGIRHPHLHSLFNKLPGKQIKQTPKSNVFGGSNSSLREKDIQLLVEGLSRPEVQKALAEHAADMEQVDVIVKGIAAKNPLAKVSDESTVREALEAIEKYGSPAEKKQVEDIFKKWDMPTDLETRTLADAKIRTEDIAMIRAYEESVNKALGITTKAPSNMRKLESGLLPRMWREQALLSVRNLAQNAVDIGVKSALHGVNLLRGKDSAFEIAKAWGRDLPASVRADLSRKIGGLEEFAGPEAPTALGQLPGVLGRGADRLVKFRRRINAAMETAARAAAWAKAAEDHMKQAVMPRFLQEIKRQGKLAGVSDDVLNGIVSDISKAGVRISADDVTKAIGQASGNEALGTSLGNLWGQALDEASEAGEALANKIHFDYGDERNIEAWVHVRAWAPFHFWATRNIPYYLQTMADNPWLMRTWANWNQLTEQERERTGLTGRTAGKLEMWGSDALLGVLLGPASVYFNPMVAMSIADQFKPMSEDPDMPLAGRILEQGGRVGLNLVPWFDIPLTAFGVFGEDAEPGNLLRHSGLIKDITGVDIEAPIKAAVRWKQGKEAPLTGSAIEDYKVRRRIAEMSVEETGKANSTEYVKAMTDPESEIFQRAHAFVKRQQAIQDALNFIFPFPTTMVDTTEAQIRQASANLGEVPPELFRQLSDAGDLSTAFSSISTPQQAQIAAGFAGIEGLPPFWGNLRRQQVMEENPTFAAYLAWKNQQPPGADDSVKAFIESTK